MRSNFKDWRHVSFSRHEQRFVPEATGIYALLRIRRSMGLPLEIEPVYVGVSHNLRQRLGRHLNPLRAHNEHVGSLQDRHMIEFWCNLMPREEIVVAEKTLIRAINPSANKIRYQN